MKQSRQTLAQRTRDSAYGRAHRQQRERLLARHTDGAPCPYCGQPMYHDPQLNHDGAPLEADHSTARAAGNIHGHADTLCCRTCNRRKADMSADEYRALLATEAASHSARIPCPTDRRIMNWPKTGPECWCTPRNPNHY